MRNEFLNPTDPPSLLIENALGNRDNLRLLISDLGNKENLVGNLRQGIDSFSPQQTLSLFRTTLHILSDSNHWSQDQRDGALELLRLMNLRGVEQTELEKNYLASVNSLDQNADLYGEIDALLSAGKIIAPFIPDNSGAKKKITWAWKKITSRFTGKDLQKVLDDVNQIKQLMPEKADKISAFDQRVETLVNDGELNQDIAVILQVKLQDVQRSLNKLKKRGMRSTRKRGPKSKIDQALVEKAKDLINQGVINAKIAEELNVSGTMVYRIAKTLISRGEIPRRKRGRKKIRDG